MFLICLLTSIITSILVSISATRLMASIYFKQWDEINTDLINELKKILRETNL